MWQQLIGSVLGSMLGNKKQLELKNPEITGEYAQPDKINNANQSQSKAGGFAEMLLRNMNNQKKPLIAGNGSSYDASGNEYQIN